MLCERIALWTALEDVLVLAYVRRRHARGFLLGYRERFLRFIFGGDKSTLPRCRQKQESYRGANDREEACRHVVVLDGAPTAAADILVPEVGLQYRIYSIGLIPPCHRFDTSVAGAGAAFDATTWALNRFDSS